MRIESLANKYFSKICFILVILVFISSVLAEDKNSITEGNTEEYILEIKPTFIQPFEHYRIIVYDHEGNPVPDVKIWYILEDVKFRKFSITVGMTDNQGSLTSTLAFSGKYTFWGVKGDKKTNIATLEVGPGYEKRKIKRLLYFVLSLNKSYDIPYQFKSNKTRIIILKDKIICQGDIQVIKEDTDCEPEEYTWKDDDYVSLNLTYDPYNLYERFFLGPTEERGWSFFPALEVTSGSYIISSFTNEIYKYELDQEDRIFEKNKIRLKKMIEFFKDKHPDHKVFTIKYSLHFSLGDYASISDGEHIYFRVTDSVDIRGISVSGNYLIDEILPVSLERSPQYVLYREPYNEFHIVIKVPSAFDWANQIYRNHPNFSFIISPLNRAASQAVWKKELLSLSEIIFMFYGIARFQSE